ncbi:hypothetical protein V8C37DRAFT_382248 [Trichoderma ceciliae]
MIRHLLSLLGPSSCLAFKYLSQSCQSCAVPVPAYVIVANPSDPRLWFVVCAPFSRPRNRCVSGYSTCQYYSVQYFLVRQDSEQRWIRIQPYERGQIRTEH